MKENTFDIPSVKFCIVYDISNRNFSKSVGHYFGYDICLIPFEAVDGLSIDDVLKTIKTEEFIFAAVSLAKAMIGPYRDFSFLLTEKFDSDRLETLKSELIDETIEKIFEEKYNSLSYQEQRIYNCFFERYQDGSYEKTKERIKRLEMRK